VAFLLDDLVAPDFLRFNHFEKYAANGTLPRALRQKFDVRSAVSLLPRCLQEACG
jgi:hypothetical protein